MTITKNLSALLQLILGTVAAILYTIGWHFVYDPQYSIVGGVILMAGLISSIGIIIIHWRHTFREKERPAVIILTILGGLWLILVAVGVTAFVYIANQDSDIFNASINPKIYNPPEQITAFSAISFFPDQAVISPINALLYTQITNKTSIERTISGISVESGVRRSWWPWPIWSRLCPVDLRHVDLVFMSDPKKATRITRETNLDSKLDEHPLAPNNTVAGWLAFECPQNSYCQPNLLRISILDSTGATHRQVLDTPTILPTLQNSTFNVIGPPIDLTTIHLKRSSSCR